MAENFSKFHIERLNEMAIDKGTHSSGGYGFKLDWESIKNNQNLIHLIKKHINSKRMNLYSNPFGTKFYLTNDSLDFLGAIELENKNKRAFIVASDSYIEKGFYNIMFSAILGLTNIEELISDYQLSSNAIKAYENLIKQGEFKIKVIDLKTYEYFDFSKEKLLSNEKLRVSVSEGVIKEGYERFFEFVEKYGFNKTIDQRCLYGQAITEMEY